MSELLMNICREFGCQLKSINMYEIDMANIYIIKRVCINCSYKKYEKKRISGMNNYWHHISKRRVLYLIKNRNICKMDYARDFETKEKLI